jgi:hypothetical protein
MKNIAIILLVLKLHCAGPVIINEKPRVQLIFELIDNYDYKYLTDKIKWRYAFVIDKNSIKYNLNSTYMVNQIWTESRFKWWDSSGIAHGPMGIQHKWWSHLLYKVDPKIKKYIKSEKDHIKFLKRIGYNIEIGSIILSNYIHKNDGDLGMGYIEYWAGRQSWQYKKAKKNKLYYLTNKYTRCIMKNTINLDKEGSKGDNRRRDNNTP